MGRELMRKALIDQATARRVTAYQLAFGEGADHAILRALPALIRINNAARTRRLWFD